MLFIETDQMDKVLETAMVMQTVVSIETDESVAIPVTPQIGTGKAKRISQ